MQGKNMKLINRNILNDYLGVIKTEKMKPYVLRDTE